MFKFKNQDITGDEFYASAVSHLLPLEELRPHWSQLWVHTNPIFLGGRLLGWAKEQKVVGCQIKQNSQAMQMKYGLTVYYHRHDPKLKSCVNMESRWNIVEDYWSEAIYECCRIKWGRKDRVVCGGGSIIPRCHVKSGMWRRTELLAYNAYLGGTLDHSLMGRDTYTFFLKYPLKINARFPK